MQKKIALLHRYQKDRIKETNAAFPYLEAKGIDVLTFKEFDRINTFKKFWKSLVWIIYAPMLVAGRGYDVIYCDDSYPFYPALVKLVSPQSKVIIRIGDFHLMYYYSGIAYKILHFLEKLAWLCADRIIAISDVMAEHIQKEINRPVDVALDPVDPKDFSFVHCCSSPNTVMFHGLLTKNKNVDILLKAAKILPDMDFVILGDGPDMKRLQSLAPSNVFFQGWVPFKDVNHHISSCRVGVALRSDNPGNEFVVTSPFLQYGIMGKPCLVTKRKVFGDYRWQFSDVYEMASKIKQLMQRPQSGEHLRQYVLKNHDAKTIADQIWGVLNG